MKLLHALIAITAHFLAPVVALAGLFSGVWLIFHGLWSLILWNILFCFLGAVALGLGALASAGLTYIAGQVFKPRIAAALGTATMYLCAWVVAGWFISFHLDAVTRNASQSIPLLLLGGTVAMVPFAGAARGAGPVSTTHILINGAQGATAVATVILLFRAESLAWIAFTAILLVTYVAQIAEPEEEPDSERRAA